MVRESLIDSIQRALIIPYLQKIKIVSRSLLNERNDNKEQWAGFTTEVQMKWIKIINNERIQRNNKISKL